MKKFLIVVSAILAFYGCGGEDAPINEYPANPKEYIVSFGFTGEITNIEESPLRQSSSNDIYGIQVYSSVSTEDQYKPYAHGLFDNKSNMSIKLLDGYKYKFIASAVVNGKNKLFSISNKYYAPFFLNESMSIDNSFTYISDKEMSMLRNGSADIKINYGNGYGNFNRPNIDRYFGETSSYIPSEGSSININMKRVSFGVKVVTDGLTEGKLKISLENSPIVDILSPESEIQEIFSFYGPYPYKNWIDDNYTETINFSTTWEKEDGANIPLSSQNITFKRNMLTTITLKIKDNSINSNVNIANESKPMGDNGNIIIESDGSSDTDVNT